MKTAERNSRIRWADMFSVCANGTAGRNRRCSSTWGWKQEKLQRWERYFLLTSPSIEQLTSTRGLPNAEQVVQDHSNCGLDCGLRRQRPTPLPFEAPRRK